MGEIRVGSRVNWRYRPRGGYGWVIPVAGVVRVLDGKTAQVDVARKVAGQWRVERRRVRLASLVERTRFVAVIDAAQPQRENGS